MPKLPLAGGCACGALRYELSEPPLMVYNCHCRNCQKISGSAFATPMTVMEASLSFTRGRPSRINWVSDAGNERYGLFCGSCGSRIANGQVRSKGTMSLRSGTLDDTTWVKPAGDIWTRSAQPWASFVEGGVHVERQPTDYGPFIEGFRAQGVVFERPPVEAPEE
jgi:hypothetical protein